MIFYSLKKEKNTEESIRWNYLVSEVSKVFGLTYAESEDLYKSSTAKIIAAIPFAASCKFPERYALLHLGSYIAEKKGFQDFACHTPEDDKNIYSRLTPIANFEGGNKEIIHHGMTMLALIMIEGYKNSMEEDKRDGSYNPFVSGSWDYKTLKRSLLFELKKTNNQYLDSLFYSEKNIDW